MYIYFKEECASNPVILDPKLARQWVTTQENIQVEEFSISILNLQLHSAVSQTAMTLL